MSAPTIRSITYLYECVPSRRALKFRLSNGTTIRAEACHESWQQWGGAVEELYVTMPTVEAHNDWLHGGEKP
ncbi:MAG: hypothetical protein DDT20_00837 [Firmicutes bacterium]|nr:hypothetical protein [Bacillota bacterium]